MCANRTAHFLKQHHSEPGGFDTPTHENYCNSVVSSRNRDKVIFYTVTTERVIQKICISLTVYRSYS